MADLRDFSFFGQEFYASFDQEFSYQRDNLVDNNFFAGFFSYLQSSVKTNLMVLVWLATEFRMERLILNLLIRQLMTTTERH